MLSSSNRAGREVALKFLQTKKASGDEAGGQLDSSRRPLGLTCTARTTTSRFADPDPSATPIRVVAIQLTAAIFEMLTDRFIDEQEVAERNVDLLICRWHGEKWLQLRYHDFAFGV
jgi:hypothetical protein